MGLDDREYRQNDSWKKNSQNETKFKFAEPKNKKELKNNNKMPTIVITGAIVFIVLVFLKSFNSNPIIGKWRSETNYSFMGKSVNEIEFTNDSEYALGMRFKVNYEIDEKRIIVTDEFGIGTIYEVIDKNTITSNALGFKTVLRKIN